MSAHPEGWGHGEWSAYVRSLRERGYPVDDPDRVGDLLERERLRQRLRAVRGLGPQKVEILVERFGAMWRIQEASAEEFQGAGLGPALAGRVRATL